MLLLRHRYGRAAVRSHAHAETVAGARPGQVLRRRQLSIGVSVRPFATQHAQATRRRADKSKRLVPVRSALCGSHAIARRCEIATARCVNPTTPRATNETV